MSTNALRLSQHAKGWPFGSVSGALSQAFARLATWQARAAQRHHLSTLDDHVLKDIGLTRADVSAEVNKPFWRA